MAQNQPRQRITSTGKTAPSRPNVKIELNKAKNAKELFKLLQGTQVESKLKQGLMSAATKIVKSSPILQQNYNLPNLANMPLHVAIEAFGMLLVTRYPAKYGKKGTAPGAIDIDDSRLNTDLSKLLHGECMKLPLNPQEKIDVSTFFRKLQQFMKA